MDWSKLVNWINDFGFWNFLFSYSATALLDFIRTKPKKNANGPRELARQLMACFYAAHQNACNELGWEFNLDAFCDMTRNILTNPADLCNFNVLSKMLANSVHRGITDSDVETWIQCFEFELTLDKYAQIRELIKLHASFKKGSIPHIQRQYIERLETPCSRVAEQELTLLDLYSPNEYSLSGIEASDHYEDIMELLSDFLSDKMDKWLQRKKINVLDQVNALILIGHQCTGKTTLLSKILYEHYFGTIFPERKIHLVSFSDRSFRKNDFTPHSICTYLSIDPAELHNALLLVDGFDESDWSESTALSKLEYLISDLEEFKCKLIVTSRPKFLSTSEIRFSFDVYLQPFSIKQADTWLEIYEAAGGVQDADEWKRQIRALPLDIRKIILIPYVFQLCIDRDIPLSQVADIVQLYKLIFVGKNARFAATPYNPKARITPREWEALENAITNIAIEYFKSCDAFISVNDVLQNAKIAKIDPDKLETEFLLFRRDEDHYSFLHESIPNFLIAFYLYKRFNLGESFNVKLASLKRVICDDRVLPTAITDFIEQLHKRDDNIAPQTTYARIKVLKEFLSDNKDDMLVYNGNIEAIQRSHYAIFMSILRIVLALARKEVFPFEKFDLFAMLNKVEMDRFIKYSNWGSSSLECLKICEFSGHIFSGINFQEIDLYNKKIKSSIFHSVKFMNAKLEGAYLLHSDFSLSNFENALCQNTDFSNSILFGCCFKNARLNGANFSNAILNKADLRGAKLKKCKFAGASMEGMKILEEQLRDLLEFDIDFIRKNKIEVYSADCLVPDEMLEDVYRRHHPVSFVQRYT